jgi:peptidoglycan/LPS O-acetylase OafA/YrhL
VTYLIHVIVIYNVLDRLVLKISHPVRSGIIADLLIISFVAVSVGAAITLYRTVDLPLRRRLKSCYKIIPGWSGKLRATVASQ